MENKGPQPATAPPRGTLLTAARARVLDYLETAPAPVEVKAAAADLGQHPNTVRQHLDGLVEAGLATSEPSEPEGRGRPAWRYAAVPHPRASDPRLPDYVALATALAAQIALTSDDPHADALSAGETWGRSLVAGPPATSAAQARRRVVALLEDRGFAPSPDARCRTVRLRRCPLLEAARAQPDVICTVHLGLIRGVLSASGVDVGRPSLTAFAEDGACVLRLDNAPAGSGA